MTSQAITFDFHQTLASCEGWFQLETQTLATDFLRWYRIESGERPTAGEAERARSAYRALRVAITEHGREQDAESCVATVLSSLSIDVNSEHITEGVERLMRDCLDEVSPLPGAIATVQALAHAGVPLGVVSSAVYHPFLEWSLERFGLSSAFAVIVTSASSGYYKCDPSIYTTALGALRADPDRSLHVGDSYRWDVLGANRAGMRTVWLRPPGDTDSPTTPWPNLTLFSLEDAAPLLLAELG
ncbi:MAG: HAD family hydrolase [Chloroflexota bacterium]|nr:HAD family hydrolase [Chloroflexota bacterium]